ncbi:MAG: tRNA (N(6)-L-threonylcarbamoyladenosine(37)-C(2))-methylthiotransferase MtaB [Cytophagaceae bacterium]|jgi:threonylcarbamoyladenosine tRNA methylthiotransferase MtaB|nr:tRNA (N(6)-L-threonylcarbamoyladenosine(37)-C(2))-methylthiotransferase MtaB [Cytophagaceae bacterium]
MKIAFKTLGCRLNQYETDALAHMFRESGYEVSQNENGADAVIINTCTVTNQSNQKSRNIISRAIRANGNATTVVTGCMAVSHREQLLEKFPNIVIIDNNNKSALFHRVDSLLRTGSIQLAGIDHDLFSYHSFTEMFHTRSLVKIQDGCDNFCTYCIIPFVRGRAVSCPVEVVLNNVREVIQKGAKEIVITGVNISRYHNSGVTFSHLIEKILNLDGDFRLRISSVEPDRLDNRLFALINHPRLAPHLHLCLQSGSDKVLSQMKRMYTVGNFLTIVEKIRTINPLFNFTTDVIVGFPNETNDDFNQSLSIARQVGFGHIHIFKYSVRHGTRAQQMTNHIPEKVKTERSRQLHELAAQLTAAYRQPFDNTEQRILVERFKNGVAQGYNDYYVPMQFATDNPQRNRFATVKACVKEFEKE